MAVAKFDTDEVKPDEAVLGEVSSGPDAEIPSDSVGSEMIVRPDMSVDRPAGSYEGSVRLPYLSVVHGVGNLSQAGFTPGDLVLGKEHLIAPSAKPNQPRNKLKIIVLNHVEYWKEYLSSERFTAGERAQVFRSKKDAIAAGFTTEFNPVTGTPPTAPMAMTWAMLIEKPEGIECELFCISANGKLYAPAYMALERSAFRSVDTKFGFAVRYSAKTRGIASIEWFLYTKLHTAGTGNKVWVPEIQQSRALTDAEIKGLKEAAMGGEAPVDPDQV